MRGGGKKEGGTAWLVALPFLLVQLWHMRAFGKKKKESYLGKGKEGGEKEGESTDFYLKTLPPPVTRRGQSALTKEKKN